MDKQYCRRYSSALGRDMEYNIYGQKGRPMLYIPCQNGRFFDFEDFHMTDAWAPWIESGRVMVFSVDTLDRETWSNVGDDPGWRISRHEQWMRYLVDEMAPLMREWAKGHNGWTEAPGILAFGCSLGATHAANLFFRWPDTFDGLLALSGIYTGSYGFGGYMDERVYLNSPVDYLANMPPDHPYIEKYNRHKGVICAGQGPWEVPETTRRLKDICAEKGIHLWVDLWGGDVAHDWPWWYRQVAYFAPYLLGQA